MSGRLSSPGESDRIEPVSDHKYRRGAQVDDIVVIAGAGGRHEDLLQLLQAQPMAGG
jgi:hypothetical protein